MPTVVEARNLIVNQIVDGVDNSITPSKVRQVMLAIIDSLSTLEGPGFTYSWSTTTTAGDPGSATIRGNNATQASITNFYFSETSNEGNIQGYLAAIFGGTSAAKGVIIITDVDDHDNFIVATVTSDTDSGAYRTLAVNTTSAGGAIADGATVIVQISPVGDAATPTLPERLSDNPTAITDWNTALSPGWYRLANGAANQPIGGWNWGALVLPGINGNNQLQFGFAQNNSGVQFYMRERNFTVWSSWLKLALTQAEQDGRYLKLSGGALTNGISFGSNFGASNTDLSKHLALYSTTYGFGVTSNRLNAVLPGSAGWYVNIGGTDYLTVTSALLKYGTNDIWHAGNKASAAEIRSATSGKGIDPANVFAANAWVPVAYAANMAIDQSTGFHFTTTLTGDTALVAMTNKKQQAGYFEIKQDATGGRAITSYSTDFFLPGGTPTIDTAPNARNMFVYATLADNKVMLIYMGSD